MDRIQREIERAVRLDDGDTADRRVVQFVVLFFCIVVMAVLGTGYWLIEHGGRGELLIIAPPEKVKTLPKQQGQAMDLRVLSLNDPAATARTNLQDQALIVTAPKDDIVPETTAAEILITESKMTDLDEVVDQSVPKAKKRQIVVKKGIDPEGVQKQGDVATFDGQDKLERLKKKILAQVTVQIPKSKSTAENQQEQVQLAGGVTDIGEKANVAVDEIQVKLSNQDQNVAQIDAENNPLTETISPTISAVIAETEQITVPKVQLRPNRQKAAISVVEKRAEATGQNNVTQVNTTIQANVTVQVSSVAGVVGAAKAKSRFQKHFKSHLNGRSVLIKAVFLEDDQLTHRLSVSGFNSYNAASQWCDTLKNLGNDCIVRDQE